MACQFNLEKLCSSSMNLPKPGMTSLMVVWLACSVIGPALLKATTVVRLVRNSEGQVRLERDPIGQFTQDWLSYAILLVGALVFIWWLVRLMRLSINPSKQRHSTNLPGSTE